VANLQNNGAAELYGEFAYIAATAREGPQVSKIPRGLWYQHADYLFQGCGTDVDVGIYSVAKVPWCTILYVYPIR
jgi:hypothetical protein